MAEHNKIADRLFNSLGSGPESENPEEVVERVLKSMGQSSEVPEGTVLRGSATSWLLGKPFEDESFGLRQFMPSQHLGAVGLWGAAEVSAQGSALGDQEREGQG